jgi:transposase
MLKANNQSAIGKSDNHRQEQILTPFQRRLLQKSLQEDLPQSYRQRIEIMLLANEGKSQAEICRTLGCCQATVRHWTHIARAGMAHQWQDCPIGRPKAVNEQYRERLKELVNNTPRDYGYCFRRWTVNWLKKHLAKELGIEISDRHLKRLLKQMGLSTIRKPKEAKLASSREKGSQNVLIHDLKSANSSEPNGFWLFNPSNVEQDDGSRHL